jgi:hypothetical protein
MDLELCAEVSTPHHRFFHASPDQLAQLRKFTLRGGCIKDYSHGREFLGDVLGYDMSVFDRPSYHSSPEDGVLGASFNQWNYQREKGKLVLDLAYSIWTLEDGELDATNFEEKKGNLVRVVAHALPYYQVLLEGGETCHEGNVISGRFGTGLKGHRYTHLSRACSFWGKALTDLKRLKSDDSSGAFLNHYHIGGSYGRLGVRLGLRLDGEVDLAWMVDNGRKVMEELNEDKYFRAVLNTIYGLLDAGVFMGDDKVGLAVLRQQIATLNRLFPEDQFGSNQDVLTKQEALEAALVSRVQEVEDTYLGSLQAFNEAQQDNSNLWKFLSMI